MLPLIAAIVITATPQAEKPATNKVCPVMGEAIDVNKSPKVVVEIEANGKKKAYEYYICCMGCAAKLQKDPLKYLNADGTLKNAKK
jgi:hypothetical protein